MIRNIDLSVYTFIRNLLPSSVTVVDGYPVNEQGDLEVDLKLPSVASERVSMVVRPFQLAGYGIQRVSYLLTVYGRSKVERDELAYTIQTALDRNHIPVFDYSGGFSAQAPQVGVLVVDTEIEMTNVPDFLTKPLYWQAEISFSAYYSGEEF